MMYEYSGWKWIYKCGTDFGKMCNNLLKHYSIWHRLFVTRPKETPVCRCAVSVMLVCLINCGINNGFSRRCEFRWWSNGLLRRVVFSLNLYQLLGGICCLCFQGWNIQRWRWRQRVPPKRWYATRRLHSATTQKTAIENTLRDRQCTRSICAGHCWLILSAVTAFICTTWTWRQTENCIWKVDILRSGVHLSSSACGYGLTRTDSEAFTRARCDINKCDLYRILRAIHMA
jgi:hypothetical protein